MMKHPAIIFGFALVLAALWALSLVTVFSAAAEAAREDAVRTERTRILSAISKQVYACAEYPYVEGGQKIFVCPQSYYEAAIACPGMNEIRDVVLGLEKE